MKLAIEAAHELISNMKGYFQINSQKLYYNSEEPLRDELFSSDQMDRYGKTLAETHELSKTRVTGKLISRLGDNEKILSAVRKILVEAIRKERAIPPAGEWLIDNFYLIEEQMRNARKHLPKGYSKALPQLLNASPRALTRVYDIALQVISHSDGRIDLDRLSRFITSYQSVTHLQIGELWAIPIMLRLTLIENLRRVSAVIAMDMIDRNLADYWAKQMLDIAANDPKSLILVTADMARSNPPMSTAFVSEMSRQLQGKGAALALPITWLDQKLAEDGMTISELVNTEIQKQAVNQVSVSNSIGSIRLLSSLDWRKFVEVHSIVEQTLRLDITGTYPGMDFPTRDQYRHVVESIAKRSEFSENEVAKIALKLAQEQADEGESNSRKNHVGYYLVDKGIRQTRKLARVRATFLEDVKIGLNSRRLLLYLGSIMLISLAICAGFMFKMEIDHTRTLLIIVMSILILVAASQLAITIVNFFSTLLVKPNLLPRMDFSEGVPAGSKTLVVIPTMLSDAVSIEDLVEMLEVRYLANKDNNINFALLTDFTDAQEETLPVDEVLVSLVQKKIRLLKRKYEIDGVDIFYLFHRPRRYNVVDKIWMGYERKRGKLSELNGLLRGCPPDRFSALVGDYELLLNTKYIITLDSDTQLPGGAAWKMIATMAHPLNHAFYDETKMRVTEGYGILQPRVTVSLPEAGSTFYSRLHGNEPGIDPYTQATSDVYQDLFKEGSFIGKGIYDLDVFENVLNGRFSENRILSHDLLEGSYIRAGLISNVELFEKYPTSYQIDMKRRSRWTRGDWQIFSWFLPFIPRPSGGFHKNPLSALSKWKIFDNIRRSLIPIALTLLIILGWTVLAAPLFWTVAVTAIIVFPIFVSLVWDAFIKPDDIVLSHHLRILIRTTGSIVTRTFYTVICLPYEAYVYSVAIMRTMWRMLITRKKLLEWNPSNLVEFSHKNTLAESYLSMWIEPFLAISLSVYITINSSISVFIAGFVLAQWLLSPYITWLSSLPAKRQKALLTDAQNVFLQKIARKTWGFFERFVGEGDNWLPPDNFQQYPVAVVAHRTSPTNIGMSLLAGLSAHDFGYVSLGQFLMRTEACFSTLQKMERYRGHFYNWYDTETLEPLLPKYISTVDSGNLAAHLLILRQGLFEKLYQRIANPAVFQGLLDTVLVLSDTLKPVNAAYFLEFIEIARTGIVSEVISINRFIARLKQLAGNFETASAKLSPAPGSESEWWHKTLSEQLQRALVEAGILTPFLLEGSDARLTAIITLDTSISLSSLVNRIVEILPQLETLKDAATAGEEREKIVSVIVAINDTLVVAKQRIALVKKLGHECIGLAAMEWAFLYDRTRHLLSIGYKVDDHTCDPSFYDMLASEARLCTFFAIAQGLLPEDSWFALGRLLTRPDDEPILLSWSGSMFEYLMPLLVMPSYENTLLDQTYISSVKRQIVYGKQRGIPWGISESGYNMVDANSNYQYRAFGVPGLGLKRGLEVDLVIAPYATALALMVAPKEACENLELLAKEGFEGPYGFFEAVDYTPSRLQRGQSKVVIQSFMAHHQGMSLLSLSFLLHGQPMQRRFEAEPQFRATLLLLQERIPNSSTYYAHTTDISDVNYQSPGSEVRIINTPNTPVPQVQLLSNGKYHVMVTNSGGGYSRWKDLAITRWREDLTLDNWGVFCYIRDLGNGEYWCNTYQPTHTRTENFEVAFSQGRIDFHNSYKNIDTHTEIVISPEDDIEMRRIHITNKGLLQRRIEVTSYAEVVLAQPAADAMQAAFSNLFVQTEILNTKNAIMCTRRPRSEHEHTPWMFHSMRVHGPVNVETSYETDRMEFIGHGNTVANPDAMRKKTSLSGKQGSVLDPIVAIRHVMVLEPGDAITMDLIIGVTDNRAACEALIEKYQDRHHKDRVFELAWTHSQVILRQINATEIDAQLFGRLAGSVIYANAALRAEPSVIIKNHKGQSGLWGYAVSGDLPIVLLQIRDQADVSMAKQLIQAHTYWRLKGLIVDLVIWNEDYGGYRQLMQNEIHSFIPGELVDKAGGVFLRGADQISNEDRTLFQTVARVIICTSNGSLADHLNKQAPLRSTIARFNPLGNYVPQITALSKPSDLQFFNGFGGFSKDGREYIIVVDNKTRTALPWVNVIANAEFGTVISESGHGYSWTENAHEMRLSTWSNDPVSDSGGEIFYLRDEENGHYWSATALPRGGESSYAVRHGFGYSVFEHTEDGISSEMTVFVDIAAPVKFTVIKVRNNSKRFRRLSATGYVEWVLGDLRPKTAMYIITEIDPVSGAFFAKNPYSTEMGNRVAFLDVGDANKTYTGDRTEFIGRNGSLQRPDAMNRIKLSGKLGVALDPCAAIQVSFDLEDGEEREITFRLGAGKDVYNAREIIMQFRGADAANISLEKVKDYWRNITDVIQVETPDNATNIIANGWLTYQTLSCRLWGRSGFYQSGGAFGFRDQLQDVLSLLYAAPELARKQILLCASRQFEEGDAQHWWHPPIGRGVRTRISDDYLWLPFVASRYVTKTGDSAILDESVLFLSGRLLNPGEESYYELPIVSDQTASLYEHCVRAIKHALVFGERGLPLMGTGDWNDGMDRVGAKGKGESVWLGFFLYTVLIKFVDIAILHGDAGFAETCKREAARLGANIEENSWDGEWYRRAYFDDGTPLGSEAGDECKIDSISQSWSLISGVGSADRTLIAMNSAEKRLIKKDIGIIQLLDPPFDKTEKDPGYIKGYVPGVRENGGQYTHAAIWMVMAFAKLGNASRTWELLQMINPINHGRTAEEIAIYKVEPYVMAADVYARSPHEGRGGWTWYSGAAGWMYQLIIESFLGLQVVGKKLTVSPCIPAEWTSFKVRYRFGSALYHIAVQQKNAAFKTSVFVDNVICDDGIILMEDDGKEHAVDIAVGQRVSKLT